MDTVTVMTIKPMQCSTWLSMATTGLEVDATISQRALMHRALTHIRRPAPYFLKRRSLFRRNGVSLHADMK